MHLVQLARFALIALFAIASSVALAQAPKRVGFLNVGPAEHNKANVEAFRAGLRDMGHVEGRSVVVDYRWADSRVERLPGLVSELLALKPDVIVSTGGVPAAMAVKAATSSVPVVFITGDPLAEGLVASLSKPGGNMTGVALLADEVESKRLELLKQVLPKARRIALVWNPSRPTSDRTLKVFTDTAHKMGFAVLVHGARNAAELDAALKDISTAQVDALAVLPDPVLGFERQRIVEFALKQRLPGVYFWREFAVAGGLLSYATSLTGAYKRTGSYVDRILKGAKPGDLPVEQPTTFELVINLKTAKALGITIPPSLLALADEVIQ